MTRVKTVSSFYQVAPSVVLELKTRERLVDFLVHQFLFPVRLKKCRLPSARLKITADFKRSYFTLQTHSHTIRTSNFISLLPLIDTEARWVIAGHLPAEWFPVHSAAVQKNNRSVLLLGESGAGKSRTLLDLVGKGYTGLSDELNFLNLRTFRLAPYLRHWNLKSPLPNALRNLVHITFEATRVATRQKLTNHYFPISEFQNRCLLNGAPLFRIYYLKSRQAKVSKRRALTTVEIIQHLADNSYVYVLRHHPKAHLAQNYQRRFLDLFKQLAKRPVAVSAEELSVKKGSKLSQLI